MKTLHAEVRSDYTPEGQEVHWVQPTKGRTGDYLVQDDRGVTVALVMGGSSGDRRWSVHTLRGSYLGRGADALLFHCGSSLLFDTLREALARAGVKEKAW